MLFATDWPTEVWAVEYTNICDQRVVDIMENLGAAQAFIENVNKHYWAEPILLHSPVSFLPARPTEYVPLGIIQTSVNSHPTEPKARIFFRTRRRKWYYHGGFRGSNTEMR
jgi:hypothetical protein